MSKQLSRLKPNDYDILFEGSHKIPGKITGVDSPEFGKSGADYIEMVISTTTGVFLDSFVIARGQECQGYKKDDDTFSINPGLFLREKGYFSGEYNIEFNFLREVAGSEQGILVDNKNTIYNGTRFVNDDGLIYKGGEENPDELETDEFLLREFDNKYFIEEISADRTELRLGTLPINSLVYQQEFKGLGSDNVVLTYDNDLNDTGQNKFQIPTLASNSLPENIIGGKLSISDAFRIPGLNFTNDTFNALTGINADTPYENGVAGLHTYGMSLRNVSEAVRNGLKRPNWDNNERHSAVYGGDNDFYKGVITNNFFGNSDNGNALPSAKGRTRNGYDRTEILQLVENNDREGIRNLLFRDIGTGTNENYSFTGMAESFIAGKQANPDDQWYDGAATIGWTSYRNLGFPLWIRCNDSEITKFESQDGLDSYFTIKVSGRATTTDASQQLRDYEPVEYTVDFEGENSFFIIPRHPNYKSKNKVGGNNQDDIQGAVFDIDMDFTIKFGNVERTFSFSKPSVFNVVPDDNNNKAREHIEGGFL